MPHLEQIFERLKLTKENGLHFKEDNLPDDYPGRIKIALEKIDYDAMFTLDKKPFILFKEFSERENVEDEILKFHNAIWNIGEIPVLFIILPMEIRIYNGFVFDKKHEVWEEIKNINKDVISKTKKLDDFSYMNIISGNFLDRHGDKFSNRTRVQDKLLTNLKSALRELINKDLDLSVAQNLIGRIIFSRYLIDRKIISKNFFKEKYDKRFDEIITYKIYLYDFFEHIKKEYNGDLFPITENEIKLVKKEHLKTLFHLFTGTDLESKQTVLVDPYDFSIIPIELISSIYEAFLTERKIQEQKSFYTPSFLVDYILDTTLNKSLNSKKSDLKVLDPACGSGVFLVESIRKILEKKGLNNKLTFIRAAKIVEDCIFGIDIDENAINITIFSIYLALLDYCNDGNPNKLKFPKLKNKNIFIADFFDTKARFNSIIGKVDVIIGNPPWGQARGLNKSYRLSEGYPGSYNQIAMDFLMRVKDFSNEKTNISLIVTSKILYNDSTKKFRKEFLEQFFVDEILETSAVRRSIFENAIGPAVIISYRYANGKYTLDNKVLHRSLKPNKFFYEFKKIIIQKYDMKYIKQGDLIKWHWLFKSGLMGNVLDFNLIKRLMEKPISLKKYIKTHDTLLESTGLQITKSKNPKDISYLKGRFYVDPKKAGLIQRYHLNYNIESIWEWDEAYTPRSPEVFQPPQVLIKSTVTERTRRVIAAYSDKEVAFQQSIYSIKGSWNDVKILKNILGLLNSKLFSYYLLLCSSGGVERTYTNKIEILEFPLVEELVNDQKLFKLVEKLEEIRSQELPSYDEGRLLSYNEGRIIEEKIDKRIFDIYKIDNTEKDVIDYAFEISIPNLTERNTNNVNKELDEPYLREYAQIFVDHFNNIFNGPKFFEVKVYSTKFFIAMKFQVVSKKSEVQVDFVEDEDFNNVINILGISSFEKISDLYVQKDIKGFEKSYFYVIKPKEFQLWHKAVSRLDLAEFIGAMFRSKLAE